MSNSFMAFVDSAIVSVFVGIGALILGCIVGFFLNKILDKNKLSNNKSIAAKVLEEAYAEAKTVKK